MQYMNARFQHFGRRVVLSFAGAILLVAAPPLAAQVVINEVDYDQSGTDAAEFFELKNNSLVGVQLDPYSVELVNGTGGGATVYNTIDLPNFILAPGDYYVVCGDAANVANCDLDSSPNTNFIQNGAPDAIGLRLSGTLVDAVSYEGDSGAPYTEGSGSGLVDNSAIADAGLSRCADGTDTGQNNVDFSFQSISPGASNDCPGPQLVINEIDYDQPGTDDAEFIEIKNVGTSGVSLSGVMLELVNGTGGGAVVYNTIGLPSVTLAAGDYFVVCGDASNTANCDLDVSPNTNLIQNGAPDAVAIVQGGAIIDTVSYEGSTGAPYTEGSGSGLSDVSTGNPDMSISRCADGNDTDQNNVDLIFTGMTPGTSNDCGGGGGELVINEIDYDQPGADGAEFIEIYNGGNVTDLSLFELVLVNGTGGGAAVYNTISLPAVSLAAGDYFVVCGDASTVFNCDLDVSPSSNLVQNGSPDAVAIAEAGGGVIVDTVSYEGNAGAPYTEGSGSGLEDPGSGGVGGANENKGISRFPNGADTDQNNVDLSTRCITPGAANSADSVDCAAPGPPSLVVNEIDYDQPGGDTAEFVEIKNVGSGSASLSGVELLLVNGTGGGASIYGTFALPSVTLAAGGYYIVCSNAATVVNCDLAALSSIQNGAPDAVAVRFNGSVILDTVSYEGNTGAPYTEGSGSGLTDSGSSGQDNRGISRFPDGIDTDQNNVDLLNACITPGAANTDRTTDCTPTGPAVEIWEIQGAGAASPFAGSSVATLSNVVTCLAPDGFFMQTPTSRTDGDIDTSDGIFVFTGGAPTVSVGDTVDVGGSVGEFFGFTEFSGASVTVVGTGTVPAPVVFDATVPSPDPGFPSCAIEFECYEGMLIEVADGTVTGPNQRFNPDPIAEVHITAAPIRTFREEGVEDPGLMMPPIPTWDGNPEVFELDPDKLGLTNQIIPAGSSFSASGVLGFEFGGYELWPQDLTVDPAPLPVPVRPRALGESTVGSLNLFRLFDDIDDPTSTNVVGAPRNDFVVSTAEYMRRLAKLADYIIDVMASPGILAVQEAEKLEVLQDLAVAVNALDASVNYTSYLIEGNDIGTIDVGFMVRDNVQVDIVTQLGASELFNFDVPASALHDRPPLLLEGVCDGTFPISVMVVHMRSLGGIETTRTQQKRFEQAESVAQKVQDIQTADPEVNLVVLGDFNAFEFTDGFVDLAGIIKGDFDPAKSLVCSFNTCTDLVAPDLTDQVLNVDSGERYSFIFRGNAQILDHAMTSDSLGDLVTGLEFGRGNADAAVDLINDDGMVEPTNLPLRSSDHDGLVLYVLKDEDKDGVPDEQDVCLGTVIPESVPTRRLGTNRWALVDGDTVFDTTLPNGNGPGFGFTIEDTAGCSCEQIIEAQGLGNGHTKFGCSNSAMLDWVALVNP